MLTFTPSLFFTCLTAAASATQLQTPLLVTYWGQDGYPQQQPLRSYCDLGYNVVVLGFIDQFGNVPFNMQMNSVSCSTGDTSGCEAIQGDISYCQRKGVKVLMSMGGAIKGHGGNGSYGFDNGDEANQTAEKMYNMFFSGTDSERPFSSVQLDGVDLDIEEPGEQYYYDAFVEKLRELQSPNDLIVSAAPECKHGCPSNCNPLEQTVTIIVFDYLFVQFYNDDWCSLGSQGFDSSLKYWLNTNASNIVLGVPGSNRSNDVNNSKFFIEPEEVVSIYSAQHSLNNSVDGIGIWQASSNWTEPSFFHVIQQGVKGTPISPSTPTSPTPTSTHSGTAFRAYDPPRKGTIVSIILLALLL